MGNAFVALIGAIGVGGWIYAKTSRRTGGNAKSALLVAAIAALFAFIVLLSLIGALDRYLLN
jgi:hypothetical protein